MKPEFQKMDVELELDERGFGLVKLNGEEVGGRVKGVSVLGEAGQPLSVQLTVWPTRLKIKSAAAHVSESEAKTPTISREARDLDVNGRFPATGDGT